MPLVNVNTLATFLAIYARQNIPEAPRGALLIRSGDGSSLIGVFGSGDPAADDRARHEIGAVRLYLTEAGIAELGYSRSPDGLIWMLVAGAGNGGCQTAVGRFFHQELVELRLDEALARAWQSTRGGTAGDAPRTRNLAGMVD